MLRLVDDLWESLLTFTTLLRYFNAGTKHKIIIEGFSFV